MNESFSPRPTDLVKMLTYSIKREKYAKIKVGYEANSIILMVQSRANQHL